MVEIEILENTPDKRSQLLKDLFRGLGELRQKMTDDINACEESLKPKPYFNSVQFRGQLKRQIRKMSICDRDYELIEKENKIWDKKYCFRHSCEENVDIILRLQSEIEKLRN